MNRFAVILSVVLASVAFAEDRPPRDKPELRVVGYGGSLQAPSGSRALEGGGAGVVLGFAVDQKFRRNLTGSFDLSLGFVDYDLPVALGFFGADTVDVSTAWMGYLVKGVIPAGRVELYAGAGPGIAYAEATVPVEFLIFFRATVEEESDWGLGLQTLVGLDFSIGARSRLGFEYRRLEFEADFGELSGGEVDVGGNAFVVVYRKRVGR